MITATVHACAIANNCCNGSDVWLETRDPSSDARTAYNDCHNASWLLWLAGKTGVPRRMILDAVVQIIRLKADAWARANNHQGDLALAFEAINDWTPESVTEHFTRLRGHWNDLYLDCPKSKAAVPLALHNVFDVLAGGPWSTLQSVAIAFSNPRRTEPVPREVLVAIVKGHLPYEVFERAIDGRNW